MKSLGSCAAVAKEMMKNEGMQEPEVDFDGAEMVSEGFLSAVWPELKDRGGLRSSRWRARVSAAQFLLSLAEHDLSECEERAAALLEVLLQAVVFGTALVDSQWQVLRRSPFFSFASCDFLYDSCRCFAFFMEV